MNKYLSLIIWKNLHILVIEIFCLITLILTYKQYSLAKPFNIVLLCAVFISLMFAINIVYCVYCNLYDIFKEYLFDKKNIAKEKKL